jgi:hypothetical protein
MNIAIVGWGSLIWRPGGLRIKTRWRLDGPKLPIEFARISRDRRLTLVIHPGSKDQPTYWAVIEFRKLDEARGNLRERENAKNLKDIHYLTRNGDTAVGIRPEVMERVKDWLAIHEDLQAVIWTGLPSNWKEKRKRDFIPEDAVNYLRELEAAKDQAFGRAREYVTHTPRQIQTSVRKAMRTYGWEDVELPSILFED